MSLTPGKARVDSVRASLRVLLFFLLRSFKKTAWRRSARHGLAWSCLRARDWGAIAGHAGRRRLIPLMRGWEKVPDDGLIAA